jgi:hypothetical protein
LSSQLHDFSPYLLPNGLFWTVKVPNSALTVNTDGSITLHLVDVPVTDAFTFPPPPQAVPGISPIQLIPAKLSLDITYMKGGNPRHVRPTSHDPLSPFNWAGTMWDATNSGSFSLAYDDGSFSASGSFNSNDNFGEMGFEKNGAFLSDETNNNEANNDNDAEVQLKWMPDANAPQMEVNVAPSISKQTPRTVLLKGRVPVNVNF